MTAASQGGADGGPVDAVIAWVDGGDDRHRAKRERYLHGALGQPVEAVAATKRRFSDNDEIRYCLRSIRNHAPWIRRIWLITDDQTPRSIDRAAARADGIEIVDHRAIFAGFEALLPTFNSLAIETLMWRVPDLAPHFIYFNDDMFLARPTERSDFFEGDRPILRGRYPLYDLEAVTSFHDTNRRHGARLLGWSESHYFAAAHVAHAIRRDVLEELFDSHLPDFARNAAFRFRDRSQFWSVSMHDHGALETGRAVLYDRPVRDWAHFSVKFCRTGSAEELRKRLGLIEEGEVALGCVNYMERVVEKVPGVMSLIGQATGPARSFEKA